jgi:hypothetical protein
MKTLYALVLVCMSAPTLAFGCESDRTLRNEIYEGSSTAPVTEVEDYSFTRERKVDSEIGNTATVLAPATPQLDYSIEVGADFFVNEIAAQSARKVELDVEIGADFFVNEIAAQLTHKNEQNDVNGHEIQAGGDYTASIPAPWTQHIEYNLVGMDPDF